MIIITHYIYSNKKVIINKTFLGEEITKTRSVAQACDCRDALAKGLYGRLFSWIVNSINQLIQPYEGSCDVSTTLQIGVLDIFGFENFPQNSFEQVSVQCV